MANREVERLASRFAEVPPGDTRERVDIMLAYAWELGISSVDRMRTLTDEAKAIAERIDYERGQAYAERNLGYLGMFGFGEELEAAAGRLIRARNYFESVGELAGLASVVDTLVNVYLRFDALDKALVLANQTLEWSETLGDTRGLGWAHHNLGQVHRRMGEDGDALRCFDQSVACFEAIDHPGGLGRVEELRAILYAKAGEFARAETSFLRAIESWEREEHEFGQTYAHLGIARLYLDQGKGESARPHFEAATRLGNNVDFPELQVMLKLQGARLLALDGRLEEAEQRFRDAIAEGGGEHRTINHEIDALERLAALCEQRGALPEALGHLRRSVELSRAHDDEETRARVRNMQVSMGVAAAEREAEVVERLLLNTLPRTIVRELRLRGQVAPVHHAQVTVLFTDFVGFTKIAEQLEPGELVAELDTLFTAFDEVATRRKLEKLKTIGDAYMAAAGIPSPITAHALAAVLAALEIRDAVRARSRARAANGEPAWGIRVGLSSGPLVAGVIGRAKFAYDVWGDTVNTAARMESSGAPDRVNISASTHALVAPYFVCEHRGKLVAKNKGCVDMYFVDRIAPEYAADEDGRTPGPRLLELLEG